MNISISKKEKLNVSLLLIVLGVIYLIHAIIYTGSTESGDGLRHYFISRFSWQHPEEFLDLWGKPFFTLVSSPFSQFGLLGIKIFNIICALYTSYLCYLIARFLNFERAIISIIFLGFTPIYFLYIQSGLTEIFFGLLLVLTIFSYLKKKYFLSTILISFLPFVRSEGYLLLPLFAIILLYRKKYFNILLLATGNIVYTILGYFYFHDILWLHHHNPYDGHMSLIYGHGPLFHFVQSYDAIWGRPLSVLLVAGLIYVSLRLIYDRKKYIPYREEEYILIYGCFIVYFIAHSVFWWKGLFNSLGLERVMTAIMPLSALISLQGMNYLIKIFNKNKIIRNLVIGVILIFVVMNPFKKYYYPFSLNPSEKLVDESITWFKNSEYKSKNNKIFYLDPFIGYELNIDVFNSSKVAELWGLYPAIDKYGYKTIPDSSIIFWDAHFGPNECGIPLEKISSDPHFLLLNKFKPKESFTVLGGYSYEINIFMKTSSRDTSLLIKNSAFINFENTAELENPSSITTEKYKSPSHSCHLNSSLEFSPAYIQKTDSVLNKDAVSRLDLKINILPVTDVNCMAVLSFHKNDQQTDWYSFPVKLNKSADWVVVGGEWNINPISFRNSDYVKIYIWNNTKNEFYLDDMNVEFH